MNLQLFGRVYSLRFFIGLLLGISWGFSEAAPAIIFYATADSSYNSTTPTGTLTNSGWQFQGKWQGFLGTPIAPNFFITAAHVGGLVGDKINYRGVDYSTIASFGDSSSDLQIWQICGSFPDYAPFYTNTAEMGKVAVFFGRGSPRGVEVVTTGIFGGLKGWQWGGGAPVMRWGTNAIAGIANGGSAGDLLHLTFDAAGGDEAMLAGGDSGGGMFIKDGSVWKLAGINYGVDGPFNTNSTGSGFFAAIFDEGGLYTGGEGSWVLTPDTPVDMPSGFYATRISAHQSWITSTIATASSGLAPVLQSAANVEGTYGDVMGAAVDTTAKTITVPLPSGPRYYRLTGCAASRITSVKVTGNTLVLGYQ